MYNEMQDTKTPRHQDKGQETMPTHCEAEVARTIFEYGFTIKYMPLVMRSFRATMIGGEPTDRRWRCSWDMECFQSAWCDDYHEGSCGLLDAETTDSELAKFDVVIRDGKPERIKCADDRDDRDDS